MSNIEDRLWMDLIREPEAGRALAASQPSPERARSRRPSLAVGGVVLLGAIIAVVATLTATTSTPPAYAVTVNSDGSVALTLNEVIGVRGANEALARLGVRARVAQIAAGCTQAGEIDRSDGRQLYVEPQKGVGRGFAGINLIIYANAIPQGDTVLITAQLNPPVKYHGREVASVSSTWGLYRGAAPTCRPPLARATGDGLAGTASRPPTP
jgi:hypothetical protein